MKFKVNETCIGCGLCVSICPEVFSLDENTAMAVAVNEDVDQNSIESAEEAKDECPVGAIESID